VIPPLAAATAAAFCALHRRRAVIPPLAAAAATAFSEANVTQRHTARDRPRVEDCTSQLTSCFMELPRPVVFKLDQRVACRLVRLGIANDVCTAGIDAASPTVILQSLPINCVREVCDQEATSRVSIARHGCRRLLGCNASRRQKPTSCNVCQASAVLCSTAHPAFEQVPGEWQQLIITAASQHDLNRCSVRLRVCDGATCAINRARCRRPS